MLYRNKKNQIFVVRNGSADYDVFFNKYNYKIIKLMHQKYQEYDV